MEAQMSTKKVAGTEEQHWTWQKWWDAINVFGG